MLSREETEYLEARLKSFEKAIALIRRRLTDPNQTSILLFMETI